MLPGRPSNIDQISFAPECFEVVGEVVEYKVLVGFGYPKQFGSDRAAAEKFVKRTGLTLVETRRPEYRRVKWF